MRKRIPSALMTQTVRVRASSARSAKLSLGFFILRLLIERDQFDGICDQSRLSMDVAPVVEGKTDVW